MGTAAAMEQRTEEETSWEEAAAAIDDDGGLILQSVNLNSETEMNQVYEALNITKIGPKSRLRAYVRGLQTQQQQDEQQKLHLFKLVFRNIPTGSSGAPHIHQDLEDFPLNELEDLVVNESSTPLYRNFHRELDRGEGKVYYSRKMQVRVHLENLVNDVIRSCKYGLRTDIETALNVLKVGCWVRSRPERRHLWDNGG